MTVCRSDRRWSYKKQVCFDNIDALILISSHTNGIDIQQTIRGRLLYECGIASDYYGELVLS